MSPGTTWAGKLSNRSRFASLRNPVGTSVSLETPAPGVLTNEGFREGPARPSRQCQTRVFRFSETVLGIAFSQVYGYDEFRERGQAGRVCGRPGRIRRSVPQPDRQHRYDDPGGPVLLPRDGVAGPDGAGTAGRTHARRSRRGAAAGPGRGAQAADDTGESGSGPQAPEGRNGSQRNRSDSRRVDPIAVPLVTRVESVNLSSRDEGCRHRGFWQPESHGGSRR